MKSLMNIINEYIIKIREYFSFNWSNSYYNSYPKYQRKELFQEVDIHGIETIKERIDLNKKQPDDLHSYKTSSTTKVIDFELSEVIDFELSDQDIELLKNGDPSMNQALKEVITENLESYMRKDLNRRMESQNREMMSLYTEKMSINSQLDVRDENFMLQLLGGSISELQSEVVRLVKDKQIKNREIAKGFQVEVNRNQNNRKYKALTKEERDKIFSDTLEYNKNKEKEEKEKFIHKRYDEVI